MVVSPTINILVYTLVGGSSVTLSIRLQNCKWFAIQNGQELHTCQWSPNR